MWLKMKQIKLHPTLNLSSAAKELVPLKKILKSRSNRLHLYHWFANHFFNLPITFSKMFLGLSSSL
jgi:hypothetical protein